MAKKTEQPTTRRGSRQIGAEASQTSSSRRMVWIAGGFVLALIVILAAVALLSNRSSVALIDPQSSLAERVSQPVDRRLIGDPKAPVQIVAYEDFQCGHCQRFNAELESTIIDEIVASGQASFEFRHRFVIGPDSITAGMAAECAADQGRFWDYHDILFEALRRDSTPGSVTANDLKRVAKDAALDTGAFDLCFDSREHYEKMLREDNEAKNAGINSTPTIFINNVQYSGGFVPAEFKAAVEAAAAG